MIKLVSFDYTRQTVTITKQIGNVVYLQIMTWQEMKLKALECDTWVNG